MFCFVWLAGNCEIRQCGGVWGVGPLPISISFGFGISRFEFFPLFGCWECVGKKCDEILDLRFGTLVIWSEF